MVALRLEVPPLKNTHMGDGWARCFFFCRGKIYIMENLEDSPYSPGFQLGCWKYINEIHIPHG